MIVPTPGLPNKEMYLGICYKKCVVITNGEKPYRITPFTCCKTKGVARELHEPGCFLVWKQTSRCDFRGSLAEDLRSFLEKSQR